MNSTRDTQNCLLDTETVEYFSRLLTSAEVDEILQWCTKALKSACIGADTNRSLLIEMLCASVLAQVRCILDIAQNCAVATADTALKQCRTSAAMVVQPLFVQYYCLLLQTHARITLMTDECATIDREQRGDVGGGEPSLSLGEQCTPSDQMYKLDDDRARLVAKIDRLKLKINDRSAARHAALCSRMQLPVACDLRASALADWKMQQTIERARTKPKTAPRNLAFDDDLTVRLFAEHTAQRLLEKAVTHVIFPAAAPTV